VDEIDVGMTTTPAKPKRRRKIIGIVIWLAIMLATLLVVFEIGFRIFY
jgi:hypothetical protein